LSIITLPNNLFLDEDGWAPLVGDRRMPDIVAPLRYLKPGCERPYEYALACIKDEQ
jgi:hypothetical protein